MQNSRTGWPPTARSGRRRCAWTSAASAVNPELAHQHEYVGGHAHHCLSRLVHADEGRGDDGDARARLRQTLVDDPAGKGDAVAGVDRPQPLEIFETRRGTEAQAAAGADAGSEVID